MVNKYIYIILATTFLLLPEISSAAIYQIVFPNGRSTTIRSSSFSNREYISLGQIHSLLFSKYSYSQKKKEIYGKSYKLKASQGSFYILQDTDRGIKIAQMTAPAICVNGTLYLPLESFFLSLPTLGIYNNTEIIGNKIALIEETKQATKHKTIVEKTYEGTFSDHDEDVAFDQIETNDHENDFSYIEEGSSEEEINLDEAEELIDEDFIHIEDNVNSHEDSDFDKIEPEAEKGNPSKFDDFKKYESKKVFSENQQFKKIEAEKEDFTYTEPALKFSFLYSSNYLRDGFKNIPDKKARINKNTEHDKIIRNEDSKDLKYPEEQQTQKKTQSKKENQIFPPNVYVLPENLIRRELDERK